MASSILGAARLRKRIWWERRPMRLRRDTYIRATSAGGSSAVAREDSTRFRSPIAGRASEHKAHSAQKALPRVRRRVPVHENPKYVSFEFIAQFSQKSRIRYVY